MSKDHMYERFPCLVDDERNVYVRHMEDDTMRRVFDEKLKEVPTKNTASEVMIYPIKPGNFIVTFKFDLETYNTTTIEEVQALYYDDEFYGNEFYITEEIYHSVTDGHMVLTKTVKALLAKTKELFLNFSLARYHYNKRVERLNSIVPHNTD